MVSSNERKVERTLVRIVTKMVKVGGGEVMMWGCMNVQGLDMIYRLKGRMVQYLYKKILECQLIYTLHAYDLSFKNVIFQQGINSKHTSKVVSSWLKLQGFSLLKWLAQFPNFNPIENL